MLTMNYCTSRMLKAREERESVVDRPKGRNDVQVLPSSDRHRHTMTMFSWRKSDISKNSNQVKSMPDILHTKSSSPNDDLEGKYPRKTLGKTAAIARWDEDDFPLIEWTFDTSQHRDLADIMDHLSLQQSERNPPGLRRSKSFNQELVFLEQPTCTRFHSMFTSKSEFCEQRLSANVDTEKWTIGQP
mmetsp:Transcript_26935/g.47527  ORF Transcript_26935/g.47527 Transcript_26935/m.47527 type:complete len:187 (-) Transcript_26935:180-740(-)